LTLIDKYILVSFVNQKKIKKMNKDQVDLILEVLEFMGIDLSESDELIIAKRVFEKVTDSGYSLDEDSIMLVVDEYEAEIFNPHSVLKEFID